MVKWIETIKYVSFFISKKNQKDTSPPPVKLAQRSTLPLLHHFHRLWRHICQRCWDVAPCFRITSSQLQSGKPSKNGQQLVLNKLWRRRAQLDFLLAPFIAVDVVCNWLLFWKLMGSFSLASRSRIFLGGTPVFFIPLGLVCLFVF